MDVCLIEEGSLKAQTILGHDKLNKFKTSVGAVWIYSVLHGVVFYMSLSFYSI